MSKWRNKDGKTVKRNIVASQFGSRPLELMESPALRVLSRAAHLALLRIEIELRKHGGHDNGALPVTKQNFVEFGIHQDAVAPAFTRIGGARAHSHYPTRTRRKRGAQAA
jgi:hypothetical protein